MSANLLGGVRGFFGHKLAVAGGATGRQENEIDPRIQKFAKFANGGYKDSHLDKQLALGEYKHQYTLDTHLTTDIMSVYVSNDGREIISSIPGTRNGTDLLTDVDIVFSNEAHSERMTNQRIDMKKVIEHYPERKHIVVGHSLGGTLAEALNAEGFAIDQVHSFNPGSSVGHAVKNAYTASGQASNVNSYHIAGDPISAFSTGSENSRVFEMRQGTTNPHSLDQFLL